MSENSELTATEQVTTQELAQVIEEFEQYRERLLSDTLQTAQRAKLSKTKTLAQLEPELAKIDAILQNLRAQQTDLATGN